MEYSAGRPDQIILRTVDVPVRRRDSLEDIDHQLQERRCAGKILVELSGELFERSAPVDRGVEHTHRGRMALGIEAQILVDELLDLPLFQRETCPSIAAIRASMENAPTKNSICVWSMPEATGPYRSIVDPDREKTMSAGPAADAGPLVSGQIEHMPDDAHLRSSRVGPRT
jgi:hypothetical protein